MTAEMADGIDRLKWVPHVEVVARDRARDSGKGGAVTRYVAEATYVEIVKERDKLRRALALVNVAWHFPTEPRFKSVADVLADVDETFDRARATAGVLLSAAHHRDDQHAGGGTS